MLRKFLVCAALAVAIAVGLRTGDGLQAQSVAPHRNASLALGNPSNAKTDVTMKTNYLHKCEYNDKYSTTKKYSPELYSMSYNSDLGRPNWVAWHLSKAWMNPDTKRQNDFRIDNALPAGFTKVGGNWYAGTGFERGHMCPSEDRTGSVAENSASFFMSNMVPQAPLLNSPCWSALELYCRKLADAGNELYIVAGGWGSGGTGELLPNGYDTEFPNSGSNMNKVKVPSHCWKVILVLPNGTSDVSRVSATTLTIGVWIPNDNNVANTSNWQQYRVKVDDIETWTGYNFHRDVLDSIETQFESQMYPLP